MMVLKIFDTRLNEPSKVKRLRSYMFSALYSFCDHVLAWVVWLRWRLACGEGCRKAGSLRSLQWISHSKRFIQTGLAVSNSLFPLASSPHAVTRRRLEYDVTCASDYYSACVCAHWKRCVSRKLEIIHSGLKDWFTTGDKHRNGKYSLCHFYR